MDWLFVWVKGFLLLIGWVCIICVLMDRVFCCCVRVMICCWKVCWSMFFWICSVISRGCCGCCCCGLLVGVGVIFRLLFWMWMGVCCCRCGWVLMVLILSDLNGFWLFRWGCLRCWCWSWSCCFVGCCCRFWCGVFDVLFVDWWIVGVVVWCGFVCVVVGLV